MPNNTAQKFRIKAGMTLLTINAPDAFVDQLQPLPDGVNVSPTAKQYNQLHWFVVNKAQLLKEMDKVISMVKEDVICWIYYPKGTSGIQTDLTRDKGWEDLLKHEELQWINLVSFNETWSAFGFRRKTTTNVKKVATPKTREIFDYVDSVKKTVRLPDELAAAFEITPKAAEAFNVLSFTNRKEYIEWIVTAKRAETKAERVNGTIERLLKGWKNPANS